MDPDGHFSCSTKREKEGQKNQTPNTYILHIEGFGHLWSKGNFLA